MVAAQSVVGEIAVCVLIGRVLERFEFVGKSAGCAVEILPGEVLFYLGKAIENYQARKGEEARHEADQRCQDDDDSLAPEGCPPMRLCGQGDLACSLV